MTGKNPGEELVLLGKVSKAHGIRGEIKVYPYSDDPEQFSASYRRIYLSQDQEGVPVAYNIEKARVQGRQVLLQLEQCSSRTMAESLTGQQVYVSADDLPDLAESEFYLHELEGKLLVDTTGNQLGQVDNIIETPAHDLLVVRQAGKEYLIPVVADFIVEIGEEKVVLDLPPGLLEING